MKDILSSHDLTQEVKQCLDEEVLKMKWGSAGVEFGKPAQLLNAANLAITAWNEILVETLKICFWKADIIPSFHEEAPVSEAPVEDDVTINSLISLLWGSLFSQESETDTSVRKEIEMFLASDNRSSEKYQNDIIAEIKEELLEDSEEV